jgi:hypothetical protein
MLHIWFYDIVGFQMYKARTTWCTLHISNIGYEIFTKIINGYTEQSPVSCSKRNYKQKIGQIWAPGYTRSGIKKVGSG